MPCGTSPPLELVIEQKTTGHLEVICRQACAVDDEEASRVSRRGLRISRIAIVRPAPARLLLVVPSERVECDLR